MTIIWTIIIGLIAGAIAKLIMPGKDPGGFIITILLGIGGALIFTFLGRALGLYHEGESAGFIGAIIGSIIILWLYRLFLRRKPK
ncbi:MAG: GlsB/YeaQ/YmgE family stress response membrane protein [Ignavibacteriaceae bacterium]